MADDRPARWLQHVSGDRPGPRPTHPSNAWVFANQGTNVESTIALRWNGNSWTDQSDFPAWSGVTASVVIGKAE